MGVHIGGASNFISRLLEDVYAAIMVSGLYVKERTRGDGCPFQIAYHFQISVPVRKAAPLS
jgi:hypothetical protein